jgi:hypothetical protein
MKTDQELKQLAIDIVEGKVFGTWNLENIDDVRLVFMCSLFLEPEHLEKIKADKVEHFYEYMDKATPRSVNGIPTFFSMHYLTQKELDILQPFINQYKEQKESFLIT